MSCVIALPDGSSSSIPKRTLHVNEQPLKRTDISSRYFARGLSVAISVRIECANSDVESPTERTAVNRLPGLPPIHYELGLFVLGSLNRRRSLSAYMSLWCID